MLNDSKGMIHDLKRLRTFEASPIGRNSEELRTETRQYQQRCSQTGGVIHDLKHLFSFEASSIGREL